MKREFFQIVKRTSFNLDTSHFQLAKKQKVFAKSIFRYLLSILFALYDSFMFKFMELDGTDITLDSFMIYMWLFKSKFVNKNIQQLCKIFTKRRNIFICLFMYNLKIIYSNYLYKLFFLGVKDCINPVIQSEVIFKKIFTDFSSNKYTLFIEFLSVSTLLNTKLLRLSFAHIDNFFNLQYNFFNYSSALSQTTKINNYKDRISISPFASFLGFKVHCLCRFSRKQRATSYWFSRGSVPLNKLKAFVDYGFYTIPLKNSSVTIKVWIHCANQLGLTTDFKKIL